MEKWEIPENVHGRIFKYLGDKTGDFLTSAERRLEKYSGLWRLNNLTFMATNTVNLLFSCESELYGSCVLKMCIPGPETATEINCLKAYDGKSYCKLWACDLSDDVLLLERVIPGDQMWAVEDYRERARLMADTVKNLPVPYKGTEKFPSYLSWMKNIHAKLTGMGGLDGVIRYLNKALNVYSELKQNYSQSCLLHGDLHQENMLLNSKGGYTIIDPKGVVDDPVMETARFLLNEMPCDENKILEMAEIMAPVICIPAKDILKSLFIDAALSNSWCMEEYFPSTEAFEKKKAEVIETCEFVYKIIKIKEKQS